MYGNPFLRLSSEQRLPHLLRLRDRWADVPATAKDMETWDSQDRSDYAEEWNIYHGAMREFEEAYDKNALTEDERGIFEMTQLLASRYDSLLRTIAR